VSADAQAADWVTSQGHDAGSVSRFAAYVIDLAVSAGLFALGLAGTSLEAQVVTGHQVSWSRTNIVVAVMFAAWEFFYFGYSRAVSGRTSASLCSASTAPATISSPAQRSFMPGMPGRPGSGSSPA
jgi:hypothetical protein